MDEVIGWMGAPPLGAGAVPCRFAGQADVREDCNTATGAQTTAGARMERLVSCWSSAHSQASQTSQTSQTSRATPLHKGSAEGTWNKKVNKWMRFMAFVLQFPRSKSGDRTDRQGSIHDDDGSMGWMGMDGKTEVKQNRHNSTIGNADPEFR